MLRTIYDKEKYQTLLDFSCCSVGCLPSLITHFCLTERICFTIVLHYFFSQYPPLLYRSPCNLAQNRENPPQRSFLTSTSYLRNSLQTCPATEVCVLRLRLRRLDPREKTGVDCCEDALRGLVQHRQGSPGKRNWACQRGKRSLLWDPLTPRTL